MTKALEFVKHSIHLNSCNILNVCNSHNSGCDFKCTCGRDEAIGILEAQSMIDAARKEVSKASEDTEMLDLLEELDGDELEAICQGRTFRESLRQAMKGNKG